MSLFKSLFKSYSEKEVKRIEPIRDAVLALEGKYEAMSDKELKSQTDILKERLSSGETLDDVLPDAFAVCRGQPARPAKTPQGHDSTAGHRLIAASRSDIPFCGLCKPAPDLRVCPKIWNRRI